MVELSYNIQSDNGSITDQHALREWSNRYRRALDDLKDLRVASRLGSMMTAAGLVEVDTKMIQLPLCGWSNGRIRSPVPFRTELTQQILAYVR